MTDLPTLAAALLGNFATVRIPRRERLWADPVPELPLEAHCRSQAIVLRGERLVADCHRYLVRQRLLDDGHRAFFDRIEGGGADGWRLHFFCLDPSPVTALHDAGVGEPRNAS